MTDLIDERELREIERDEARHDQLVERLVLTLRREQQLREAEIQLLTADRGALAAENRVMRDTFVVIERKAGIGSVYPSDAPDMCSEIGGITQDMLRNYPHTSREVARVKALEAVIERSSVLGRLRDQILDHFDAPEDVSQLGIFFTALETVAEWER